MKRIATFAALAALIVLATPLVAGVVYEIEVTDHDSPSPEPETMTTSVEGRNLAMEVPPGDRGGRGGAKVIYRGDRKEMIVVDHDDRSYTVIDEAMFEQIGGMAAQASAAIEEALANVPEDQRAAIEEMMKERMPDVAAGAASGASPGTGAPATELRSTGERGTQAGYPCVKYVVVRGGETVRELWVTDWSNVEGGAEAAEAFGAMTDFVDEMTAAFSSAAGGAAPPGIGDHVLEHLKEMNGFPVVVREYEGGELEEESTLRSATRRTLDPADFEPPAGYKRRSMGPQ